jgi:hypothetical protein
MMVVPSIRKKDNRQDWIFSVVKTGGVFIGMQYQRRTPTGMGRTEKTVHSGAAKNPRLLKACNITRNGDMGEFFFISMTMKLVLEIFPTQRKTIFWEWGGRPQNFT